MLARFARFGTKTRIVVRTAREEIILCYADALELLGSLKGAIESYEVDRDIQHVERTEPAPVKEQR